MWHMPDATGRRNDASASANDAVAFLVELAMLALLAWLGVHLASGTAPKVVLGVVLPAVAATLWGLFAAPRARWQHPWGMLLVKVVFARAH